MQKRVLAGWQGSEADYQRHALYGNPQHVHSPIRLIKKSIFFTCLNIGQYPTVISQEENKNGQHNFF
jgi:hypothetical protein